MRGALVSETAPADIPSIVHEVLRSPGQPLDAAVRTFMEPRFGYDLRRVRVHKDAQASASPRMLNSLAYTVGRDVVFANGRSTPDTTAGQRLLAHELTHVTSSARQRASRGCLPPRPAGYPMPCSYKSTPSARGHGRLGDRVDAIYAAFAGRTQVPGGRHRRVYQRLYARGLIDDLRATERFRDEAPGRVYAPRFAADAPRQPPPGATETGRGGCGTARPGDSQLGNRRSVDLCDADRAPTAGRQAIKDAYDGVLSVNWRPICGTS